MNRVQIIVAAFGTSSEGVGRTGFAQPAAKKWVYSEGDDAAHEKYKSYEY